MKPIVPLLLAVGALSGCGCGENGLSLCFMLVEDTAPTTISLAPAEISVLPDGATYR